MQLRFGGTKKIYFHRHTHGSVECDFIFVIYCVVGVCVPPPRSVTPPVSQCFMWSVEMAVYYLQGPSSAGLGGTGNSNCGMLGAGVLFKVLHICAFFRRFT